MTDNHSDVQFQAALVYTQYKLNTINLDWTYSRFRFMRWLEVDRKKLVAQRLGESK